MEQTNRNDFIIGVCVGIILAAVSIRVATIISPFYTGNGEPLSVLDISGKITITERLSPRNLAIIKIDDKAGEKIVSDLPMELERGDVLVVKYGKIYKLFEKK